MTSSSNLMWQLPKSSIGNFWAQLDSGKPRSVFFFREVFGGGEIWNFAWLNLTNFFGSTCPTKVENTSGLYKSFFIFGFPPLFSPPTMPRTNTRALTLEEQQRYQEAADAENAKRSVKAANAPAGSVFPAASCAPWQPCRLCTRWHALTRMHFRHFM